MRSVAITAAAVLGVPIMAASSHIAGQTSAKFSEDINNKNTVSQPAPVSNQDPEPNSAPTETQSDIITVKAGDYLVKIAKTNDTTALRLFYANTNIADPDLIYPGEQLRIPAANEQLTPRPVPTNNTQVQAPVADPKPSTSVPAVHRKPVTSTSYSAPAATPSGNSAWDRLAACESGGNWQINTGNGFYGGLQFTPSSWHAVGGTGLPSNASKTEQIMRAKMLQARQGWGAWPVCSVKAGLR